jgi:hypothetical protein
LSLSTPVALFIFNRPHTTAAVFEAIRQAQPQQLLIVADGPRGDRPGEEEQCQAARAIVAQVDWPCQVETCYAEQNMGCQQRLVSGLDWVFDRVEAAIILEDDCLPHASFFPFCQELLDRYREDLRVGMISGQNNLGGYRRNGDSYYFAQIPYIWGWATWQRSWRRFQLQMEAWPTMRDRGWLADALVERGMVGSWRSTFEHHYEGFFDAWDYSWTFTSLTNNWLNPTASVNLVSNIGFGPGATNTHATESPWANVPVAAMGFPLQHPAFFLPDRRSEGRAFRRMFQVPWTLKVERSIKRAWRRYQQPPAP